MAGCIVLLLALEHDCGIKPRDFVNGNQCGADAHGQGEKEHAHRHLPRHKNRCASVLAGANHEGAYRHSQDVAHHRAHGGLLDDHFVHIAVGRTHGLERAKLAEVVHGGGVDSLSNHDESNNKSKASGEQHSHTRAGGEHPVNLGHAAEFMAGQNFNVFHLVTKSAAHGFQVGPGSEFDQQKVCLVLAQADEVLRILEAGKDVRRSREGTNAMGEPDHTSASTVDFKDLTHAGDAELLLVEFVEDDGVWCLKVFDPSLH